jgi:phosphatidylglycerol:prolipoprotein diacylglycerol transferase
MIPFPKIDPALIRIGPLEIRWYGLMYVLGFFSGYLLIRKQKASSDLGLNGARLQDLFFYLIIGLIVGARIGYVVFYQYASLLEYLKNPIEIIAVWHGGMSFHGGLLGTLTAGFLFCRRRQLPFWQVADVVIVTAPIGVGLGRIGNFINGELYGRPASVPWAMVFPDGGPIARHPSQLYEALLEGAVLFTVLWLLKDRPHRPGALVCLFLAGYGALRFVVEFFREPDPQIGLFADMLSMGQLLCIGMIMIAFFLWFVLPKPLVNDKGSGKV